MISLKDKCIFITGASRGIGRQTAITLAASGANLILNARSNDALDELKKSLYHQYGTNVMTVAYDVQDSEQTKKAFLQIKKEYGQLDALVNNAAILESRLIGMIDEQSIQNTFQINLISAIAHLQYAARLMKPKGSGTIINLSSIMGTYGSEGQVLYSASKAGIEGVTRSASKELAPYQIRVNAVAPGFIDTDLTKDLSEQKYNERIKSIKMGRIGKAEDVANMIMFLCSDLANYITGQVIGVDGGMVI